MCCSFVSATHCVHVWVWWLIEMMWCCHQAEGPALTDALERSILEPYLVKHWGIKLATNAAITVLRVDQVGTQTQILLTHRSSKEAVTKGNIFSAAFNSHTCKGHFSASLPFCGANLTSVLINMVIVVERVHQCSYVEASMLFGQSGGPWYSRISPSMSGSMWKYSLRVVNFSVCVYMCDADHHG